jgi:phosphoglycolate phosphatase
MTILPEPKVIALDLDLTIYDIIHIYDELLNETRKELGLSIFTKEEYDELREQEVFNYTDKAFKYIFGEAYRGALNIFHNKFHEYEISHHNEISGARDFLSILKQNYQVPVIAVSNANQHIAKKILRDMKLIEYFDSVTGMKEGRKPKPDSELLIIGLNKIGKKPGTDVWFMGDSNVDTECARTSSCIGIRFVDNKIIDDKNAHKICNSYQDFLTLLDASRNKK